MARNINAAQLLLEHYGKDSLSYFSLHEKKKFFFSSTGRSFLSYTIKGKIALVSGDPVGPMSEMLLLLKEFNFFIKGSNLTSCFLAVNKDTLGCLKTFGHRQIYFGKEAFITLPSFSKDLLKKRVRRAERFILAQGIKCKIYKRKNLPKKYFNQLQSVTNEWLRNKGAKEKRFTMTLGRIPTSDDRDCELVLALKNDEVIGYLTFVPVYAVNGLSLDSTRKRDNAPNGIIEFLMIQAFEYFKRNGVNIISLNFATFHHTMKIKKESPHSVILGVTYKFLSRICKTNNLYRFNNKFLPEWHERYFVFEKKRYLPGYLFAIARTEL